LSEVATAVKQMDEMTQHNAALVEQTNAAIEQTEAQASELDGIVDVFKIGNEGAPPIARGGRRPASALRVAGNAALSPDWNEF
jgi:methyl-accepting chemotaxis protein